MARDWAGQVGRGAGQVGRAGSWWAFLAKEKRLHFGGFVNP